MAEADDQSVEDMVKQVQLLELQAKRMEKLVNQRRQERADMEADNARIQRQLRYMEEMARENEQAEEEYEKKQAAEKAKTAPFSGRGFSLTSAVPEPAPAPRAVSHAHWSPVVVDPEKPSGNIQVETTDMHQNASFGNGQCLTNI